MVPMLEGHLAVDLAEPLLRLLFASSLAPTEAVDRGNVTSAERSET